MLQEDSHFYYCAGRLDLVIWGILSPMRRYIVKVRMVSGEMGRFTQEARDAALDRADEDFIFYCYKSRGNFEDSY